MMKRIFFAILLAILSSIASFAREYKPEDIPNVQLADSSAYVADPDGLLKPETIAELNRIAADIRRQSTAECYIAVVGSIGNRDINDFATELFTGLGLGKQDKRNGLLILMSRDQNKITMRTGYGLEGVLPDALTNRIMRARALNHFRAGEYDEGLVGIMQGVQEVLTDPEAISEIYSDLPDKRSREEDDEDFFSVYLVLCGLLAFVMLLIFLATLFSVRGKSDYDKYTTLQRFSAPYLALSFLGLGMPLVASLPLVILLRHWRDHARKCPNCGTQMVKIDEVHDNDYLTPAQDTEERVGSVDYDVWRCPSCGDMEILPYVNRSAPFEECEQCHARTAKYVVNSVLRQPTTASEGIGERRYHCLHCGHDQNRRYKIARLAPVVVVGGGGGRGFGGGGGFSGGGFGGGTTGGGGSTMSW